MRPSISAARGSVLPVKSITAPPVQNAFHHCSDCRAIEAKPPRRDLPLPTGWNLTTSSSSAPALTISNPWALSTAARTPSLNVNSTLEERLLHEVSGFDVAIAVQADVSDENAVAAAFSAGVLAFGGVGLVVNNAGHRRQHADYRHHQHRRF